MFLPTSVGTYSPSVQFAQPALGVGGGRGWRVRLVGCERKGSFGGGFAVFIGSALRYFHVRRCGEGAGDMRNILASLMCAVNESVLPRG